MNVAEASKKVEQALASPVETWPGYSPKCIPLVIYDPSDFVFYNHPAPSQERPKQLTAASFSEINGVMAAIIPVEQCENDADLISLIYHECFHVYQNSGAFQFNEHFDFFRSLAFYPELNGTYRALCLAEVEVFDRPTFSTQAKGAYLAALAQRRQRILAKREGLPAFVQHLERLEGPSVYVEQKARTQLFNTTIELLPRHYGVTPSMYGWSRHHAIGAATCRLLDELTGGWQAQVAYGASLTGVLVQTFGQEEIDLTDLSLSEKTAQEQEAATQIRTDLQASVDRMMQAGAIRIQWPDGVRVTRALNPTQTTSLGDGRLIHSDFLILHLPNGTISLHGGDIVEDYDRLEVMFPGVPLQMVGDQLNAGTRTAQMSLTGVESVGGNVFRLGLY